METQELLCCDLLGCFSQRHLTDNIFLCRRKLIRNLLRRHTRSHHRFSKIAPVDLPGNNLRQCLIDLSLRAMLHHNTDGGIRQQQLPEEVLPGLITEKQPRRPLGTDLHVDQVIRGNKIEQAVIDDHHGAGACPQ